MFAFCHQDQVGLTNAMAITDDGITVMWKTDVENSIMVDAAEMLTILKQGEIVKLNAVPTFCCTEDLIKSL